MERFKKALKAALSSNSAAINIVNGAEVETKALDGSSMKLLDLPPADQIWIDTLLNFLFKEDLPQIESGETVQGSLNVPGVGLLKAIAFTQNELRSISLYFPTNGDQLFEQDWSRLSSPKEADTSYGLDLPQAQPTSQDPASENSDNSAEGMFSMPLAQETPNAPSQSSEEPQSSSEMSDDTALPTNMFGSPVAEESEDSSSEDSSNMFAPAMGNDEQGSEPAENMFSVSPSTIEEEPSNFTPTESNSHAQQQQMESNHSSVSSVSNQKDKKIIFGNNDPSTTIVRNGDFEIDSYLREMMSAGASDMHLTLGQPFIYRIDGELERQQGNPISEAKMESLLLPIMPNANKKEFAEIYDTDFAYEVPGLGRFRVNMFKDNYGVGAVLRQIPAEVLTADQLNLPPAIRSFCHLHKGLVLVTGPTGSGKSTTLAAMIDLINKSRPDHILTIEDPIEFVHGQQKCLVNQREVGKHTESFKRALKAALREDPDIVLIGELRDLETIHIALETAETGHLVFGTLHTNTAVSTIDRIIDQFPADQQSQIRTMVAASLKGVVAQTLVKKKGGGRVAAHEILVPNDAVANMIRESKNHMIENHMQTQKSEGNMLLNECLLQHVKNDLIEEKQAYLKSVDKASFLDNAKRAGVSLKFLQEMEEELQAS